MDIKLFLKIMLRNWFVVALSVLSMTAGTMFYVLRQTPIYQASATIELKPNATLGESQVINLINALDKRSAINTLARKATSSAMRELVATKLNISPSLIAGSSLQATVIPQTNLIEIRALGADPELVAAISNAIAFELQGQALDNVILVEVIDTASPPTVPVEPQPARMLILSIIFGVAIGVGLSLLEHLYRTLSPATPVFSLKAARQGLQELAQPIAEAQTAPKAMAVRPALSAPGSGMVQHSPQELAQPTTETQTAPMAMTVPVTRQPSFTAGMGAPAQAVTVAVTQALDRTF